MTLVTDARTTIKNKDKHSCRGAHAITAGKGRDMYHTITKRDGRIVAFDGTKIMAAIERAGLETGEFAEEEAYQLAQAAIAQAQQTIADDTLTVEQMQDAVEDTFCLLYTSPSPRD